MNTKNKYRECMGAIDRAYLRRFNEMPFDTLEQLQQGGFSRMESWNIVNRNLSIVAEQLKKEYEEEEERERERIFSECPFCQPLLDNSNKL